MSRTGAPDGFEIASLKKKQAVVWDPMGHGPGTPWEDRGTHGVAGAFVKTCLASLTGPRKLADQIRRPETTGDIRSFVIGCGLMWGLSAAGHVGYGLWAKSRRPDVDAVSGLWCGLYVLLALAGATAGVVGLWMLYTAIYHRLVDQETGSVRRPEPMLANVTGYAFGPSLLAVVPVVGPVLALVGMFVVLIAVGWSGRVRLRLSTAVVNAVLGVVAIAAIGGAGSYLAYHADWVLPEAVSLIDQATLEKNQPAIP